MNERTARTRLHRACASYMTALDGVGPARRGWFITRGAQDHCWLGATALEAVKALRPSELVTKTPAARTVFGICNVAFYPVRTEGTETFFATKAERDAAIVTMRDRAVAAGLAESAARSGIYTITSTVDDVRARVGPAVRVTDELAALIYA